MSVINQLKTGQFSSLNPEDKYELIRRLELKEKDDRVQMDAVIAELVRLEALIATKADKGTVGQ